MDADDTRYLFVSVTNL